MATQPSRRDTEGFYQNKTSITFNSFAEMPNMIYRGALASGVGSNTRYIQEAVCERLAKDLDVRVEVLLAMLPPCRSVAKHLRTGSNRKGPGYGEGGAAPIQEVK